MHDRRFALQSLGAAAAALALPIAPAAAAPAPALRRPPRLRPGDTVGLIEPAGFTDDAFDLKLVLETVRAMGLVPKPAPHLAARYGYLAGRDEARAADVNGMFADDKVRAIFAVRGGWGSARILPHLDFDRIRANPKLLIGFSDITALHMALAARAGFTTVHGPNAASSWGSLSWNAFRSLAFDGATPLYRNPTGTDDRLVQRSGRIRSFRGGKARGRLLGGNLTVLTALMGTPYLPDFDGAILFLEEIGEDIYRVDRMLTQLKLAGILDAVAGVVFGKCTDCESSESYGSLTLEQILDDHLRPLGVPAWYGAMIGHIADKWTVPVGSQVEIDADAGTVTMLEPAVA